MALNLCDKIGKDRIIPIGQARPISLGGRSVGAWRLVDPAARPAARPAWLPHPDLPAPAGPNPYDTPTPHASTSRRPERLTSPPAPLRSQYSTRFSPDQPAIAVPSMTTGSPARNDRGPLSR